MEQWESEPDLRNDPDYMAAYERNHAEVIATQGADPHAGCSLYDVTSFCNECDAIYADAFTDGEFDFNEGISLEDGFRAFRLQHPEIPVRSDGAINGYCHGWSTASLRSQLRIVPVPFEEIPPIPAIILNRMGRA